MFVEPQAAGSERIASRLAEAAGSWRFVGVLLCWVVAWLGLNLAFRPFEPYPLVMITGLAASLATVAAFQGPLILLSQRQAAMRDRARDREAFRVAVNTEADLHRLQQRVEALTERLEAGGPAPARARREP
jgi:uncharacterized membrane protein